MNLKELLKGRQRRWTAWHKVHSSQQPGLSKRRRKRCSAGNAPGSARKLGNRGLWSKKTLGNLWVTNRASNSISNANLSRWKGKQEGVRSAGDESMLAGDTDDIEKHPRTRCFSCRGCQSTTRAGEMRRLTINDGSHCVQASAVFCELQMQHVTEGSLLDTLWPCVHASGILQLRVTSQ